NAAELDGDVTAAHYCDALRTLRELEEVIRGDTELGAGNPRPVRAPAARDDDVLGREATPGGRDRTRIDKARPGAHQFDLVPCQIGGVQVVQPQNVSVALLLQRCPVVPRDVQMETVVRGIVQRATEIGRVPGDFLRHAADVDAGAPETAGFHQRPPGALFGRAWRCGQPAAAAADHHQVEFVGHTPSSA